MPKFSDSDGEKAVRAARIVIEHHISGRNIPRLDIPQNFDRNGGIFVTLKTYPEHELRGCIGFPEPILPLKNALIEAAIDAATRDPRFFPVSPSEMDNIVVEVSLLTPPELIIVSSPSELPSKVKVGEDGLIAERGWARGLLLPQVPVELNWDATEFLRETCHKAGLSMDAWKDPQTKFYKFQAEVFGEESPRGKIRREVLSGRDGCGR
ncbi:MAG: TIGR00296 family protein [Thermoplasmata archaeon]